MRSPEGVNSSLAAAPNSSHVVENLFRNLKLNLKSQKNLLVN